MAKKFVIFLTIAFIFCLFSIFSVGAVNYTDNEIKSEIDIPTSAVGDYTFNDVLDFSGFNSTTTFNINFTDSNGTFYESLQIVTTNLGHSLKYRDGGTGANVVVYALGLWNSNGSYNKITILSGQDVNNANLIAFLQMNTVQAESHYFTIIDTDNNNLEYRFEFDPSEQWTFWDIRERLSEAFNTEVFRSNIYPITTVDYPPREWLNCLVIGYSRSPTITDDITSVINHGYLVGLLYDTNDYNTRALQYNYLVEERTYYLHRVTDVGWDAYIFMVDSIDTAEIIGYNRGYSSAFGDNLVGSAFDGVQGGLNSITLYQTTSGTSITLWTVISGIIGIALFIWLLKMFAGG